MKRYAAWACALTILGGGVGAADATETVRLAIQKTGTVAWEVAVIKANGFDKALDLQIDTTELASTDAGKIALQGGSADLIASDWVWAARERALGDKVRFAPYSTAVGAVMTPATSPIHTVADLANHSIGIAGGPIDKSWLLLQADARRGNVDLAKAARPVYGAPPLIAEKFAQGEADAALEFWNFCADLEARGFKRAIEIVDVEKDLGAQGPVSMVGYVFNESFASQHPEALRRYFSAVAKAHALLASDESAWAPIKARLSGKTDEELAVYRKRYLETIPTRGIADEIADAHRLFHALAEVGGKSLVGDATDFDDAMYYDPEHN